MIVVWLSLFHAKAIGFRVVDLWFYDISREYRKGPVAWNALSHWANSVQIRSFYGPYFPVFGLNTEKYGPENSIF